jgi:DMSO/TMAO reductase YedYZ heme-binding membrane subunit
VSVVPHPVAAPAHTVKPIERPAVAAVPKRATSSTSSRLSGGTLVVIGAAILVAIVFASGEILPASSDHQVQLRGWLTARATGVVALVLLTFEVALGLVLSHPTNKSTWKLSKRLFPWHEHLWVFTLAFVAVHGVTIAIDRFANVGWLGALVPGMAQYRSLPVAIGTIACYALIVTGLTARVTRLLPSGWWLKVHRLSLGVLALAWVHGLLAGTDTPALGAIYGSTFTAVLLAAFYRYWVVRQARPTFSTSLPEGHR